MPAVDDRAPESPPPVIPGPIRLVWALMQASHHVDDDVARRELGPFLRAGSVVEQVGAVVTWLALAGAIVAAIPVGGAAGTHFGVLAGILAMMGCTVVFGGVVLIVVGVLQQLAWGAVTRRLDARMAALGWDQPGSRVIDHGPPDEGAGVDGAAGA